MASPVHVLAFTKGDHICFFYRDADDWVSTVAPYVQLGLKRGERCFCVLPAGHAQRLRAELATLGVDTHAQEKRGAFSLLSPEETYLAEGGFDGARMTRLLEAAVKDAALQGFEGFRAMGDLGWAAKDSNCCAQLPAYERIMAKFYPGKPALGLCTYDMRLFDAFMLRELMGLHQLALSSPEPSKRAIQVRNGATFGEIVFDRSVPSLFHYTVQTDDSPVFLASGQEASLSEALSSVKAY